MLLHGFADTWRTWELVLPALERRRDVLAPMLAGHAGGPALPDPLTPGSLAATPDGRRRATAWLTEHGEDLPPDLVAHLIAGAAAVRR